MDFLQFNTPTQFMICTCLFALASREHNKRENQVLTFMSPNLCQYWWPYVTWWFGSSFVITEVIEGKKKTQNCLFWKFRTVSGSVNFFIDRFHGTSLETVFKWLEEKSSCLGPPAQEGRRRIRRSPEKDHKDDQGLEHLSYGNRLRELGWFSIYALFFFLISSMEKLQYFSLLSV